MTGYIKGLSTSSCGFNDNNPARVAMSYDERGRNILTDYADGPTPDIARTYDANGNVLTVNRGTGTDAINWSYDYNELNMLTTETLSIDGYSFPITYNYNNNRFMIRSRLPRSLTRGGGRNINYQYDALGRMDDVERGSTNIGYNINYHPSGSIANMTYGNGQQYSQTLNDRLLPESIRSAKGSETALDLSYAYNARGLVSDIINGETAAETRSFTYDALG